MQNSFALICAIKNKLDMDTGNMHPFWDLILRCLNQQNVALDYCRYKN